MNKDKQPVPKVREEHFMGIIWSMVEPFGIEDIPEVMDFVKLLDESIARHVMERDNNVSPQKKVHTDRAKFIAIFKARYLEFTDLEYRRPVTPADGKLIHQANKTLQDAGFNCDDYLKWTYTVFLRENDKFAPGTLKQVCSEFFLHKFLYDNRLERENRQRAELAKKEGHALLNKARGMIRSSSDKNFIENVKNLVKQYSERDIMIIEFRTELNKLAKES